MSCVLRESGSGITIFNEVLTSDWIDDCKFDL
jgi:hypothetical protein